MKCQAILSNGLQCPKKAEPSTAKDPVIIFLDKELYNNWDGVSTSWVAVSVCKAHLESLGSITKDRTVSVLKKEHAESLNDHGECPGNTNDGKEAELFGK